MTEQLTISGDAVPLRAPGEPKSQDIHVCPVCGQQAEPIPDNERPTTLGEPLDGPDIYSVAEYEATA